MEAWELHVVSSVSEIQCNSHDISGCDSIVKHVKRVMQVVKLRPEVLSNPEATQVLTRVVILGNQIIRGQSAAALECCGDPSHTSTAHQKTVCDYGQFLIDFSYAIEVKVVNEEFNDGVVHYISLVREYLNHVVKVVEISRVNQDTPCIKELVECAYWRQGALIYMYCHTSFNHRSQMLSNDIKIKEFVKLAYEGVENLAIKLKSVRLAETESSDYITTDKHALQLIEQGIFSDVHMLALVYAAELCYWICHFPEAQNLRLKDFNPKELGRALTTQYISLADGPLKHASWKTDKALTFDTFFKT